VTFYSPRVSACIRASWLGRPGGMSEMGHSRRNGPALPVSRCPLSSESDRSPALQRNDAMGHMQTLSILVGRECFVFSHS